MVILWFFVSIHKLWGAVSTSHSQRHHGLNESARMKIENLVAVRSDTI
jgi:hypothetical protein